MHNHRYFLRDNARPVTKALALDLIKKIHLTEKSSFLTKNNYLTFIVKDKANKCDIRKACEILYEQKVADIKVIVKKQKKRAFKGKFYIRSDVKKALVKFKDKNIIEKMFGGEE